MTSGPPYAWSKINDSTHLIIQNDKYLEFPYLYVKQYYDPQLFVVIDTGCGAHNSAKDVPKTELKDYIEDNLCETKHDQREYVVICTHCHFDHIGGIEAFSRAGAPILASGYEQDFLDPSKRGSNSLCDAFGTKTPQYAVTKYLSDSEQIHYQGRKLGLVALHTPGHTPDSLAIYDEHERWLFTGDAVYERTVTMPWGVTQDVPIILPLQGNWTDFVQSLEKLTDFVDGKERQSDSTDAVRLAAGHTTYDAIAAQALGSALIFVRRLEQNEVPVVAKVPGDQVAPGGSLGDAEFWLWQDEGEPEYSLMAPESFRKDFRSYDTFIGGDSRR